MAVSVHPRLGDSVVELTKLGQQKGSDPFSWAIRLTSSLDSMGVSLPSVEVANALVSYICWDNNVPITWKFLDKALSLNIVPPMLVLALLSNRVIPSRSSQSVAYRLYLELLKRHVFSLKSQINVPNFEMVMKSVDSILRLSNTFDLPVTEPGILVVEFIFYIAFQLLDSSLDDEGLLIDYAFEPNSKWANNNKPQEMEINEKLILKNANTVMSIEIIGELLRNKVTSRILYLARRHMPSHWESFVKRLRLLGSKSTALRSSKTISPEALVQLTSDTRIVLSRECKTSSLQKFHAVMAFGSSASAGFCHGTSRSAMWLPLDLALEDSMDGYQVDATSAIERITGLVKTLQAINGTSWHDTFLGLWIAALRFIQRERNPIEGPVPHLDTRLCLLLCITTLVVADLIDEASECGPSDESEFGSEVPRKRRNDLVSSLQTLGDYHGLLAPPQSIVSAANLASAKAMLFISGIGVGSSYFECLNVRDTPINCSGNMRHLIVEACIARNLLDTSAYFWPGYVNGRIGQIPQGLPSQVPGWSSFLKGATLTPLMINTLVSNPASSLAELEKIFEIAINGTNDERISAATILCGASLIRGWNIQEHTANFIMRLLSPPVPVDYSGIESHLMGYAPMLNVLIVGIASVDCVQIFSLLGLVPQLACSLMPICEVFGSSLPAADEAISSHAIFSNAFILLLKLWRFNHPPMEHSVGDVPTVGSHLTPEYLLALRNSHLGDRNRARLSDIASSSSPGPVFVDSFPKLKSWYRQHLACIASTLSGLVHGTPVHRIVDELLGMMFRKINSGGSRGGGPSNSTSSGGSSGGPGNEAGGGNFTRPRLPAWDILEAVPFVVDAALTACGHGTLSPRELATGLKDLADFLPASLAGIVSYFSAEVSRGIWKPVFMNGTDWPSPASNLSNVEEQIKKILAATGLDISSLSAGIRSAPVTLPLPLAAFVSLTITYKIDKASEHFLNLAGPALESLAAGCPWPCMPIVAALWTLKAKRWTDFLIFSASRTVFLHSRHAVVQLIRSCFSAALAGPTTGGYGGVGSLLGHGLGSPVAPGILYLRVYRSMRDIVFVTEEVVAILMDTVREIASGSGRVGLAGALTRVKLAASLAASLVWLTGGLVLVQSLVKETLPSWFISGSGSGSGSGMGAMLGGYALAYFTVLCGAFAWGVDSSTSASRRRPKVLRTHLEFLASALERKVALGCGDAMWRAYFLGFVSLVVGSAPGWVVEADADVVGRLGRGLRRWGEPELALALLGVCSVGPAAELIIEIGP